MRRDAAAHSVSGAVPSTLRALLSSRSPDWFTPPKVLEPVRTFAPIRLDPFGNPAALVGAAETICLPDDSLVRVWPLDGLIYCNPPYGRALLRCARKIAQEAARGAEIVTLVPARTDTRWWRLLAPQRWCAWSGRLTFLEEEAAWRQRVERARAEAGRAPRADLQPRRRVGNLVASESAPFPAALCYHGPRPEAFAQHFARYGEIYAAALDGRRAEDPPARRSVGRPRAVLPDAARVLLCLELGMSVRAVAAELGVPKNRIEQVAEQLHASGRLLSVNSVIFGHERAPGARSAGLQ